MAWRLQETPALDPREATAHSNDTGTISLPTRLFIPGQLPDLHGAQLAMPACLLTTSNTVPKAVMWPSVPAYTLPIPTDTLHCICPSGVPCVPAGAVGAARPSRTGASGPPGSRAGGTCSPPGGARGSPAAPGRAGGPLGVPHRGARPVAGTLGGCLALPGARGPAPGRGDVLLWTQGPADGTAVRCGNLMALVGTGSAQFDGPATLSWGGGCGAAHAVCIRVTPPNQQAPDMACRLVRLVHSASNRPPQDTGRLNTTPATVYSSLGPRIMVRGVVTAMNAAAAS